MAVAGLQPMSGRGLERGQTDVRELSGDRMVGNRGIRPKQASSASPAPHKAMCTYQMGKGFHSKVIYPLVFTIPGAQDRSQSFIQTIYRLCHWTASLASKIL